MARSRAAGAFALSLVLAGGCEAPPSAPRGEGGRNHGWDIGGYVSAELASKLPASGEVPIQLLTAGEQPVLSLAQAEELALAYASRFGPFMREALEDEHGGRIDFDRLRSAGAAAVVESAYEPLPSHAPMAMRKLAGPYYLIVLHQDGTPAIAVAVSALAVDLRLDHGRIIPPQSRGNEFRSVGINARRGYVPLSAEDAIRIVATSTGARVTSVPRFVSRGIDWIPHLGYWRVELDRRVRLASGELANVVHVDYKGSVVSTAHLIARSATIENRRAGTMELTARIW